MKTKNWWRYPKRISPAPKIDFFWGGYFIKCLLTRLSLTPYDIVNLVKKDIKYCSSIIFWNNLTVNSFGFKISFLKSFQKTRGNFSAGYQNLRSSKFVSRLLLAERASLLSPVTKRSPFHIKNKLQIIITPMH